MIQRSVGDEEGRYGCGRSWIDGVVRRGFEVRAQCCGGQRGAWSGEL
jgi:hypothetical protein